MEFREKLVLAHLYFRLQNHFVPIWHICYCKGMYVPRQCHLLFHHFLGFHVLRHPRSPPTSSKRWVGWPATKHQRFLWCVSRRWDLGKLFWLASTCWDCHEVLREIVASKFQRITVQYVCLWHPLACVHGVFLDRWRSFLPTFHQSSIGPSAATCGKLGVRAPDTRVAESNASVEWMVMAGVRSRKLMFLKTMSLLDKNIPDVKSVVQVSKTADGFRSLAMGWHSPTYCRKVLWVTYRRCINN